MSAHRSGDQTRCAILSTAPEIFLQHGFHGATLAQVADVLGITRSAVLFHFTSKADLLREVADPALTALAVLHDRFQALPRPLSPRRRREILTDLADLVATHRTVVTLLSRDVASLEQLPRPVTAGMHRVALLLAGPDPSTGDLLRVDAALGAIMRPLTMPLTIATDLGPEQRMVLVEAALAILRGGPHLVRTGQSPCTVTALAPLPHHRSTPATAPNHTGSGTPPYPRIDVLRRIQDHAFIDSRP